jgi:thioredoxin reductase (NADPH)
VKIFRQGNRELASELDVTGSPTLLFYKNGEIVGDKLSGGIKRSEIMTNLDALLTEDEVKEVHGRIQKVETETDVIVLGGGPAGLTAGIYLAQAHAKVILVDPQLPGGYVSTTHLVSNYPGFIEPQQGMMLSHYMSEQAKENGVEYRVAVEVNKIDLKAKRWLLTVLRRSRQRRSSLLQVHGPGLWEFPVSRNTVAMVSATAQPVMQSTLRTRKLLSSAGVTPQ